MIRKSGRPGLRAAKAVVATSVVAVVAVFVWYQWSHLRNDPICPYCGPGDHVALIVYGYPGWSRPRPDGTYPDPPRGHHAGCVVRDDSPKWHCDRCGAEWGRVLPSLDSH